LAWIYGRFEMPQVTAVGRIVCEPFPGGVHLAKSTN